MGQLIYSRRKSSAVEEITWHMFTQRIMHARYVMIPQIITIRNGLLYNYKWIGSGNPRPCAFNDVAKDASVLLKERII